MHVFALRAVEDHTMRINQCQFVAISAKSNRRSLRHLNAKPIRKNALHAGGFDPRDPFNLAAANVQRDKQDTAVTVLNKLLEHSFPADDAISVHFDLVGLQQQHGGRIQEKARSVNRRGNTTNTGKG